MFMTYHSERHDWINNAILQLHLSDCDETAALDKKGYLQNKYVRSIVLARGDASSDQCEKAHIIEVS